MDVIMKLKLNKKRLKNLSKDSSVLPADLTPQIAGGISMGENCWVSKERCEGRQTFGTINCSAACGPGTLTCPPGGEEKPTTGDTMCDASDFGSCVDC